MGDVGIAGVGSDVVRRHPTAWGNAGVLPLGADEVGKVGDRSRGPRKVRVFSLRRRALRVFLLRHMVLFGNLPQGLETHRGGGDGVGEHRCLL